MKIAILTGANGQLGKSYLNTLVKENYYIYALDLNVDGIETTEMVQPIKLDITNEDDVHNFYKNIEAVDVLINNAGIGVFTPFEQRTAQEFMKVMSVNLLGTFLMSQGAIEIMKKQKYGKIINVGSIYGQVSSDERIYGDSGRNNSEVYSATKAGVIHMTKYMATHFGKYNIQTNCISPGGIFNKQSKEFVDNYEYKTPMGRMGTPDDLQSVLKFLISKENTYVNGQNITVDGGFVAW
ncbi:SDR family oxidoreductase [Aliarcobacter cryaerophilus]|uniref:Short-chain dehydrogenase n=1 Tax=Aliarcobacter cryaerophilus TaxID=28198 RepID=A0A2S9SNI4_9BACT|nr:SDR family oxidoreductase [Aliarcobacter cryaerophilus]PRM88149.1 short-chain dehydrogenase [Aliarcobacter cryaerophilus]